MHEPHFSDGDSVAASLRCGLRVPSVTSGAVPLARRLDLGQVEARFGIGDGVARRGNLILCLLDTAGTAALRKLPGLVEIRQRIRGGPVDKGRRAEGIRQHRQRHPVRQIG